ncbi:phosphate signaling complex protein PhoU [bacterium]|nr:phosphate signaling complex protein PhoU [bacterium]MCP5462188.1 phosphate signaling complex protein PhoU [bacterium]
MGVHLINELNRLKKMLFSFSEKIEANLENALRSLLENNRETAQQVIEGDADIDRMEVEIEEECLKALALYQPVAIDLRYLIAILKLTGDLERIGDLAVNIAISALNIIERNGHLEYPIEVKEMSDIVRGMLRKTLQALTESDAELAKEVLTSDTVVDDIHRNNYIRVEDKILADLTHRSFYIFFLSVSRYLERIADHATNIAEDVIYNITGEIVRHRKTKM